MDNVFMSRSMNARSLRLQSISIITYLSLSGSTSKESLTSAVTNFLLVDLDMAEDEDEEDALAGGAPYEEVMAGTHFSLLCTLRSWASPSRGQPSLKARNEFLRNVMLLGLLAGCLENASFFRRCALWLLTALRVRAAR